MTDIATAQNSNDPPAVRKLGLLEFPYTRIVGNWKLEGSVARFALLAVPLEYYVLPRFSGGLKEEDAAAIILVALLAVIGVLLISAAVAIVPLPLRSSYSDRLRVWSICLVLNWAMTLLLLAGGYAIMDLTRSLSDHPGAGTYPDNYDVLAYRLFQYKFLNSLSAGYPGVLHAGTYLIYVCYALVAALLVRLLARCFGRDLRDHTLSGPNAILVVLLSAFVMMVTHGLTKLH